jgi:hypothetical protein
MERTPLSVKLFLCDAFWLNLVQLNPYLTQQLTWKHHKTTLFLQAYSLSLSKPSPLCCIINFTSISSGTILQSITIWVIAYRKILNGYFITTYHVDFWSEAKNKNFDSNKENGLKSMMIMTIHTFERN